MRFKLVETISSGQRTENKMLKQQLLDFNISSADYVVHHLSSEIVSSVDQLMDNTLENVLFLPKTPDKDSNAVHQFVHAAAKFGGLAPFMQFLSKLNGKCAKPIYALRVDDEGKTILNAVTLSDAVIMTMKGKM